MLYCLFLTILRNKIQDFFGRLEISALGSERVKPHVFARSDDALTDINKDQSKLRTNVTRAGGIQDTVCQKAI